MNIIQLETLIENGQSDEIIALLTSQPQLAMQLTSHKISPVLLACYYQKAEIAKIITEFVAELDIFEACAVGKFDDVTFLIMKNPKVINSFSADGFTPLGLACYFGHDEIARFLVLKAAEINVPSQNGFNVFPIHSAVAKNYFNIAKMLLNNGAYPNVCQKSGIAPLHSAAQLGNIEMIILLLEHGADITLRMEGGKLPADLAEEKGFTEIAAILRDDD